MSFMEYEALCSSLAMGKVPSFLIIGHSTYLSKSCNSCFTVYTIQIEMNSHLIVIKRRFRQFSVLANNILSQWPKEQFSGFPKATLNPFRTTSIDTNTVCVRNALLQNFLNSLTNSYPFVLQHHIMETWINPDFNPTGVDLSAFRLAGFLDVQKRSIRKSSVKWKSLYAVLVQKKLLLYKDNNINCIPVEHILVNNAIVEQDDRDIPFCFKMTVQHTKTRFLAPSKREFIKWIRNLHNESKSISMQRVGSEPYEPDDFERNAVQKESIANATQKLKLAEEMIRNASDHSPTLKSISAASITESSPNSFKLQSFCGSELNIKRLKEEKEFARDASTPQTLNELKVDVDKDVRKFLEDVDAQLADSGSMGQPITTSLCSALKTAPITTSLCSTLKIISMKFLSLTVNELSHDNTCSRLITEIQELTEEFDTPEERKFILNLLFVISPFSRLIRYQEEKNNLAAYTNPQPLVRDRVKLKSAISDSLQFLFAAVGISFVDSFNTATSEDILLSPSILQKPNRSPGLSRRVQSFSVNSPSRFDDGIVSPSVVETVHVTCSICCEHFLFHTIYAHANYCQKVSSLVSYAPHKVGFTTTNWDELLSIVDKLVLERINTLYDTLGDHSEIISVLLSVHKTLSKSINQVSTSKEAQETLDSFAPILGKWKNSNDGSVFVYCYYITKLLERKFAGFFEDNQQRMSKKKRSGTIAKSITITDFQVVKRISRGAFGRVDLVQNIATKELFAMKTMDKSVMVARNLVNQVMVERQILSAMDKHEYVVKMHYAFHNSDYLFLVMEYLPGGDCSALLQNIGYFGEDMARCYIAETIMALDYMHSKNYIHRDVKPDNLLISATGHIKLTDFGLSMFGLFDMQEDGESGGKGHRVVGTPDYLAPEALLGTGASLATLDWWSVGVTLFEFLTGIPPFNDESPEKIFDNILLGEIPWPLVPEEMSFEAQDLISKLLVASPTARLGANGVQDIKCHPFFGDLDWDNLHKESRVSIFVPRISDEQDTGYFVRNEEQKDSFVSGLVHQKSQQKDELFAGFSWVDLPTLPDLAKGDGSLFEEESDEEYSSDLDLEIELAAKEIEEKSQNNL